MKTFPTIKAYIAILTLEYHKHMGMWWGWGISVSNYFAVLTINTNSHHFGTNCHKHICGTPIWGDWEDVGSMMNPMPIKRACRFFIRCL